MNTDSPLERLSPDQLVERFTELRLIDVRAPIEFDRGHFPGAINLPLMNDDERHKVGLCYKQQGQTAAMVLGHKLVSGPIRTERVQRWLNAGQIDPNNTLIYCARGGMRSQISQQWLAEAGLMLPLVQGGYKALRQWCMSRLQQLEQAELLVVAGRTGSGKTRVIASACNALDLEGAANHRGSAFGRRTTPQPSQANFENRLAVNSLSLDLTRTLVVEDESRNIGSVHLPYTLSERIQTAPVVMLETALAIRVDFIVDDYVRDLQNEYRQAYAEEGLDRYQAYIEGGLRRIRKRLGGVLYNEVLTDFQNAMTHQRTTHSLEGHRLWVKRLLTDYYDRMYDFQLDKSPRQVVFQGALDEVLGYLTG
ncbi:MAG: tRNA 2-selenouridine(34) synthase MnmH [Saccharospirillum sp.]|nr:tRNA 2-selenouridine(34) synthase MnmH [Saccharospirillum sp.]